MIVLDRVRHQILEPSCMSCSRLFNKMMMRIANRDSQFKYFMGFTGNPF